MLGLLIQFLISWLIIWAYNRGNLGVLGFRPTGRRMADFLIFLLLSAACSLGSFGLRSYFGDERWLLNPDFNFKLLLDGIGYNIKSVLFEELIFRGVLLYILIQKLGGLWAILISAVAFGIYHWFTYEVLGNGMQMLQVFVITGLAGCVYAYAYYKTKSLYVPIAMHFGWNFVQNFIFSAGNIGNGMYVLQEPVSEVQVSMAIYLLVVLGPLIAFLLFNFILLRIRKW